MGSTNVSESDVDHEDGMNSDCDEITSEECWDSVIEWANCPTPDFVGEWENASIYGEALIWNSGEQVSIEVLNTSRFQMTYDGQLFIAKLSDRNTLCWSDGDVWLRESSSCTAPHAVPSGGSPSRDPINDEVYTGCIDSWRGNRGFVSCAVLEAQYDRQVFLHANDCDCKRLRKGDEVKFNLTLDNNGNPKACNAILRKPQSAAIFRKPQSTAVVEDVPKQNQQVDARDYFAERAKQRAQRAKQRAESGR